MQKHEEDIGQSILYSEARGGVGYSFSENKHTDGSKVDEESADLHGPKFHHQF